MERRPGTPSLLRELNDRAALELLLTGGPMTRAQLGEHTGLSKVTASQLLARLEERGLVAVAGEQAGGRGPNAALYAVVPSSAYVAGLHVEQDEVSAGVADVTGSVMTEVSVDPNGAGDPVELVRGAVVAACGAAGISPEALRAFVIGTPGVLDPRTGDPRLAVNLPAWHEGVLAALRSDLGRPVTIENDVNLAAMAERAVGRRGRGRRLRAGLDRRRPRPGDHARRAAAPRRRRGGGRDRLPAGPRRAAAGGRDPPGDRARSSPWSAPRRVRAAGRRVRLRRADRRPRPWRPRSRPPRPASSRAASSSAELAGRVATGVAADLGGARPRPGGARRRRGPGRRHRAGRPGRGRGGPDLPGPRRQVVPTAVTGGPVLRGAILAAVDQARSELLDSVATPA